MNGKAAQMVLIRDFRAVDSVRSVKALNPVKIIVAIRIMGPVRVVGAASMSDRSIFRGMGTQ